MIEGRWMTPARLSGEGGDEPVDRLRDAGQLNDIGSGADGPDHRLTGRELVRSPVEQFGTRLPNGLVCRAPVSRRHVGDCPCRVERQRRNSNARVVARHHAGKRALSSGRRQAFTHDATIGPEPRDLPGFALGYGKPEARRHPPRKRLRAGHVVGPHLAGGRNTAGRWPPPPRCQSDRRPHPHRPPRSAPRDDRHGASQPRTHLLRQSRAP
jgi:hypothetical protein